MATDAAKQSVACSLLMCKPKDFFCKRNFVPVWLFVFMRFLLPINNRFQINITKIFFICVNSLYKILKAKSQKFDLVFFSIHFWQIGIRRNNRSAAKPVISLI